MSGSEKLADGVSITEAARMLGTSRPSLSKLLSDHDFPRVKAGGKTLVSMAEVRVFYQAQKNSKKTSDRCEGAVADSLPSPAAAELDQDEDHGSNTGNKSYDLAEKVQSHDERITALERHLGQKPHAKAEREAAKPAKITVFGILRRMLSPWG